MKVLVTDKINECAKNIIMSASEVEVDLLPTMSEEELCNVIGDYSALMIRSQTKVTKKIIECAKNLKIIGRAGVGVDNIDLEAATKNGIIVVNSPDGNTNAAAEQTLALMLSMVRNIPKACQSTLNGNWDRAKFTGCEVFGKTLGIIGYGKIGQHVAKVAIAFGMTVLVCDPYTNENIVNATGAKYIKTFDEFWGLCDFITIHAPKTTETMHLINKETLSKMKKGVRIINCARGGIINEQDLRDALDNGHVASAALDVYETEPEVTKSPLFGCDKNIVLTPHLGASTSEAQLNVAIDVANQIKNVLTGGSATSAVNIPSLKPEKLEPVKDYMSLAENLGELAKQLSVGALENIEINVTGTLAQLDVSPIETAIVKGVLSSFTNQVNYVNAPILAKSKGISVTTSKSTTPTNYTGAITVKIGETTVSGALIAKNIQRIVKINDYSTSIKPEKHMLLIPHENKPSMVAKVATVIGEHEININHMSVSQHDKDEKISVMIINIDKETDKDVLDKINKIDGVVKAKYIKLNA